MNHVLVSLVTQSFIDKSCRCSDDEGVTQKEKVKISDKKKVLRETAEKRYQKEIRWWQHMDEQIETLWGQLDNLTNQLANRGGPNVRRWQPTP